MSTGDRYAIYGTGGCARAVRHAVQAQLARQVGGTMARLAFIDDNPAMRAAPLHGLPVISYDEALSGGYAVCIAIADGQLRREKAVRCARDGIGFFSIVAPTVVRSDLVSIGEGAILCDNVTLTADISIGAHFHANLYSYVEHDCVIGDYVTFAPRVSCNGNVTIGDGAYIGTNASIKQGVTIGAGAVVGMGAVVVKDVEPGQTVVGNPARIQKDS
ncbi:MAG: NeuD/PglB/VioB family sugar acetyltransferase [Rhodobiaceae bacterium]|nr:NeuD/PglB/VioB family sugar acetyltransferase [Rhodobiaceae bacterium]